MPREDGFQQSYEIAILSSCCDAISQSNSSGYSRSTLRNIVHVLVRSCIGQSWSIERPVAVIDVELSPDDSAIRPHIQSRGPCILIPLLDSARYPEVICIGRPVEWIMQAPRDPIRAVFMHRSPSLPLVLSSYFRLLSTSAAPADLEQISKKNRDTVNKYKFLSLQLRSICSENGENVRHIFFSYINPFQFYHISRGAGIDCQEGLFC